MTIMLTEVYDAFKEANVSEPTARKAAEAMAGYDTSIADIKSDLRLLKWMVGTLYPLVLAVFLKLFIH